MLVNANYFSKTIAELEMGGETLTFRK